MVGREVILYVAYNASKVITLFSHLLAGNPYRRVVEHHPPKGYPVPIRLLNGKGMGYG